MKLPSIRRAKKDKNSIFQTAGCTDPGPRSGNEDIYAILEFDKAVLLIVADGLGGHSAGEVASKLAVIEMQETVKRMIHVMENPRDILDTAVLKANDEIYLLGSSEPAYAGMGTTLVAALVTGKEAYFVNVGDSRTYLIRDGKIRQVTKDHSLVQDMLDNDLIDPIEAFDHPQKNVVMQAVGDQDYVRPDHYKVSLESSDVLLLCSDGLTDVLRDEEILNVIQGAWFEEAPDELVRVVNDRGAKDNITIVMYRAGDM